jgi:hypothetical protein
LVDLLSNGTHLADFKDECESQSSPFHHEQVGSDPM